MKKALSLLTIICLVITSLSAQKVQRGYVRTVEKPDKPAQYLAGAQIKTLETPNEATSQANGRFEIPVKTTNGKSSYTIIDVSLAGYNLVDEAKLNKRQLYSPASAEILMISREEEEKVSKFLMEKLMSDMEKTYKDEMAKLQEKYEEKDRLTKEYETQINNLPELVRTLVRLDYKTLSDTLDYQIAEAYESGDFALAVRLIDSKPSMQQRIQEIQSKREAAHFLEESANNQLEALVRDCDIKIDAYKTTFQKDSVLHYMRTKVEADPENVDYLLEIGEYFCEYLAEYDSARLCYEQAFAIAQQRDNIDNLNMVDCYSKLGSLYFTQGEYSRALEYHQKSLISLNETPGENPSYVARVYNNIGIVYQKMMKYDTAWIYLQKALDIRRNTLGNNHPEVALLLNNCANNLALEKNNSKALEYFQEAYEIFKINFGEWDPRSLLTLSNIGVCYTNLSQYDTAFKFFQIALEKEKVVLGENHPDVALTYRGLADAYYGTGEFTKCINCYQKALNIYLSVFGNTHPEVSASYHGLAVAYEKKELYDTALLYCSKALETSILIYGEQHSQIARIYNSMANIYLKNGFYDTALSYYQQAYTILINGNNYLEEQQLLANTFDGMSNIYMERKQYDKAIEFGQKSYRVRQAIGDLDGIASSSFNMGIDFQTIGRYEESLDYLYKAAYYWRNLNGENHYKVAIAYNGIAKTEYLLNQYDSAIVYYDKCLNIVVPKYGENNSFVASVYTNEALAYHSIGLNEKSIELLQKSLDVKKELYGDNSIEVSSVYVNLGAMHNEMHNYEEALKCCQKALDIRLKLLDENDFSIGNAYKNVAEVYFNQKDFPAALEYYNKALAIYEAEKGKKSPEALEVKQAIKECKKKKKEKK